MGCVSGVVHQSGMKWYVGGGCVGEEEQKDESLLPHHCLAQGTPLEQLPLLH